MKFTYLGTAACEGIPALYCKCELCETARKLGGKNIRTRSQALINDDLLIDFPPDTYSHVLNYKLDLDRVANVLFTHSHADHLYAPDLIYRSDYFSKIRNRDILGVYGNQNVLDTIEYFGEVDKEMDKFVETAKLYYIAPFERVTIGNYTVYPLLANHKPDEDCYIFVIIDKEGKTVLYANDTGYFPQTTWEFMKNFKFDFVSLDCTSVNANIPGGHMGLECATSIKERMIKEEMASLDTSFALQHISHNGKFKDYDELSETVKEFGFTASYDNQVIEI